MCEARGQEVTRELTRRRAIEPRPVDACLEAGVVRRGKRRVAAAGDEQRDPSRGGEERSAGHQYFTQSSSFAFTEVSSVTPEVPWMSSTVVAFALYAAFPFHTMSASPK